jgi:RNA polymerase sigma factor (sigma-70 family)
VDLPAWSNTVSPVEPPAASLEPDDGGLSFEEFMRREHRRVMGLLYAMTGDWHAAEDLAQDAFAEAARRWPQVSSLNRPGAWLCRVAINKAHRWRRRRGLEESAIERERSGIRDHLDVPQHAVEVWDAVRRLPPKQIEVLALRYLSGLSEAEMAEVLRIPIGPSSHAYIMRIRP